MAFGPWLKSNMTEAILDELEIAVRWACASPVSCRETSNLNACEGDDTVLVEREHPSCHEWHPSAGRLGYRWHAADVIANGVHGEVRLVQLVQLPGIVAYERDSELAMPYWPGLPAFPYGSDAVPVGRAGWPDSSDAVYPFAIKNG